LAAEGHNVTLRVGNCLQLQADSLGKAAA